MTLTVLLFAGARDAVGQSSVTVQVRDNATIAEVAVALATQFPSLARLAQIGRYAVNHDYASADTPVAPDDEIALIPPVSGGSA
ncbi:MAG: MoaD/ThiS family protein [Dehalococcoidia bacterium]|nr:MoaD/ThiS family protein [Dehalococcoidia bacterium]